LALALQQLRHTALPPSPSPHRINGSVYIVEEPGCADIPLAVFLVVLLLLLLLFASSGSGGGAGGAASRSLGGKPPAPPPSKSYLKHAKANAKAPGPALL